jgi:glycosyltransferase involved in cell wall biosynthesis
MKPPPLSVTIITLNEETRIAQAIRSVKWADEVLVIDSGSTDRTCEIAAAEGARVLRHAWKGYGQQKNYAQSQARNDWVFSLDADEVVSAELAEEICRIFRGDLGDLAGFQFARRTYFLGRWIRHGGWYPNVLVRIADRRKASWTEPQVHEQLVVRGPVARLANDLDHFSFDSVYDQALTNARFARLGGQELVRRGKGGSVIALLWKPFGKFLETYLIKRGFLDGLSGFVIAVNASHSMFLKVATSLEGRIRREPAP